MKKTETPVHAMFPDQVCKVLARVWCHLQGVRQGVCAVCGGDGAPFLHCQELRCVEGQLELI